MIYRKLTAATAFGMLLIYLYGIIGHHAAFTVYAASAAVFLAMSLILFILKSKKPSPADAMVFAIPAILVLAITSISYIRLESNIPEFEGKTVNAVGEVICSYDRKSVKELIIETEAIDEKPASIRIETYIFNDERSISKGDTVAFCGKLERPRDTLYGYTESLNALSDGAYLKTNAKSLSIIKKNENPITAFFTHAGKYISEKLDGLESADIAKAVILGDKSELDSKLKNDLRKTGASHTLAVSGLHLAIIVMTFFRLMLFFTKSRRITNISTIAFTLFYMALTGFPLSVVRAGIMLLIYLIAPLIGEETDSITSLSASICIIAILDRYAVYDIGFILSVLATFGIITAGSGCIRAFENTRVIKKLKNADRISKALSKVLIFIVSSLAVTLSAVFFTAPVTMTVFGEISLAAPISNFILLVIFEPSLIVSSLFLVLVTILGPLGIFNIPLGFLASLGDMLFGLFRSAAHRIASVPGISTFADYPFLPAVTAFIAIIIVVFAVFRVKPRYYILAPIAAIVFFCGCHFVSDLGERPDYINLFDRDKNEILIIGSGETTALFDCSSKARNQSDESVLKCLNTMEADKIDYLVISQYSDETVNRVKDLTSDIEAERILVPEPADTNQAKILSDLKKLRGSEISVYSSGQKLELGSITASAYRSFDAAEFRITANGCKIIYEYSPTKSADIGDKEASEADFAIYAGRAFPPAYCKAGLIAAKEKYAEEISCSKFIDLDEIDLFTIKLYKDSWTVSY